MRNYEWDGAPPTVAQRMVAGAYVLILLALVTNSYFGWRFIGRYDRQLIALWIIVGVVLSARFMAIVRRSD